ncbi:MAG: ATP-binding protein [Gemmatimonadaceae bacterium]
MPLPTIFDLCRPRADVLKDAISDADFAADLSKVLGTGAAGDYKEYRDAVAFFANTYPTRGLRNLLHNVLARLSGSGKEAASIFRLDTSFGGGKTHSLIALVHAARGMKGVASINEFVDPAMVPAPGAVRIGAFDGENADPANGRRLAKNVLAKTPWGELAYALAGEEGYKRVKESDERAQAPGAETIAELFGGQPTLILLDELAIYLRKVSGIPHARDQFTAFLTGLFKAVESSPKTALVFTLAVGREGRSQDAYSAENEFLAEKMAELAAVSARKATLLNPTEDDETVQVLKRRLFAAVDDARVPEVLQAYRDVWTRTKDQLPPDVQRPEYGEKLLAGYPFHPHVLETLTLKTATIADFQRVRGMLRLLARTIAELWRARPADATAIHLHHIDLGVETIRQELLTRLGQSQLVPALNSDVASADPSHQSLAREMDLKHFGGLPPYGSYVGRTVFVHTLAFNEQLKGVTPDELRVAMAAPSLDLAFVEQARQEFLKDSAYLDDRPTAPMRFLSEANLTQVIRREEQVVDQAELRTNLRDRIRAIFKGDTLDLVPFPAGPFEVADEVGNGQPRLVVMSHDAVAIGGTVEEVPSIVANIFEHKGGDGSGTRGFRNHLVFVVADEARVDEMRHRMGRRLALRGLLAPERLRQLAEHQQQRVRELEQRSEQELAISIQQCFRHVFYPSRVRLGDGAVDMNHLALDLQSTSDSPGAGQLQVVRALRQAGKLQLREDPPHDPAFVRDRTPLRTTGRMTTAALRDEFRRDPALPMLAHDDVFLKGVRQGVEQGTYVYRHGELLWGQGEPMVQIHVDEQSFVYTVAEAKREGFWPRRRDVPGDGAPGGSPGGSGIGGGAPGIMDGAGGLGGQVPPLAPPSALSAEGPLREALTRLWEQARAERFTHISMLRLRLFETGDGFKLIGAAGTISSSTKEVELTGGYESAEGSEFEFAFKGTLGDATQLKAFLEPQLRAAKDKKFDAVIVVRFEQGLPLGGKSPEELAERLTRIATGAAHVQASAEGRV